MYVVVLLLAVASRVSKPSGGKKGLGKQATGWRKLGGLRLCPRVPAAPQQGSAEALGRAAVASRAPVVHSPPTPFPTGRGEGGCSIGSQSKNQYYKAYPLAGSGNEEQGRITQHTLVLWSRRQLHSELTV